MLLYGQAVCSFLLLIGIPFYGCPTISLAIHQLKDTVLFPGWDNSQ